MGRTNSAKKTGKRPPVGARRGGGARNRAQEEKLENLIEELRAAAEALGIRVRRERLLREVGYHVRSGFCRLDDQEMLLVDPDLPADVQVELLVGAIAGRDLSGIALSEIAQGALNGESPG